MTQTRLLNASIMLQLGSYELRDMPIDKFIDAVREASEAGTLKHYIGYALGVHSV